MSRDIKESDWKVFKEIRAIALERFCERILSEMHRAAGDGAKSSHEKYLAIYELIEKRDRQIANAFNDFRRSTAFLQFGLIYSYGLVRDEELKRFSPEFQEGIKALYGR
jgi:hypothetical protein